MKKNILSFEVDGTSIDECVNKIFTVIKNEQKNCRWLACINPHSYAVSRNDSSFRMALKSANWLVPDGVGIVLASRILNRPVQERITGADIFEGVMARLNKTGGSVFFLGGTEKTLDLIRSKLVIDYPNIRLAGTFSPPFKASYSETETDQIIECINVSNADILWVGMTAPKQEKWIFDNKDKLEVSFAGAIGAVFDFYTGQVQRSHPVFQKLGLEWLPRLLQQPKRLWRRMFISAPIFLFDIFRARLKLLNKNS
ncbi:MAG: WecB/TagA/CpsF family glycosyltransferase [Hyphomicrobiales bacterium]